MTTTRSLPPRASSSERPAALRGVEHVNWRGHAQKLMRYRARRGKGATCLEGLVGVRGGRIGVYPAVHEAGRDGINPSHASLRVARDVSPGFDLVRPVSPVESDCQSSGRGFKSRRARQFQQREGGGVLSPPSTCPELAVDVYPLLDHRPSKARMAKDITTLIPAPSSPSPPGPARIACPSRGTASSRW